MRKLLYLAVTILCVACNKDEEWQPGSAVPQSTPVVYFSSDNSATIINLGEDKATFSLIMERADTNGELTVPIVVNSKTGEMEIPSSVTFADGDKNANLTISYTYTSGMSLSLSIGSGYGNPYLVQDGSLSYMCSVSRLNRIARVKYRDDSTLEDVESYIFSYEGINQFVFSNFMDSGIDMTFTIDTSHTGVTFDPTNLRTLRGDFVPLDNNYYDGGGWYLYDEDKDDYPTWTPAGWDKLVLYYYFYGYSDDYSYSYSYIDFRKPSSTGAERESHFYGSNFYFDEDFTDSTSPAIYYTLDFNAE